MFTKYVNNKYGTISADGESAFVDNHLFKKRDIVYYRNSSSKVKLAEIETFVSVDNGTVWFKGIDTVTKAKVWYGLHCSLSLKRQISEKEVGDE